MRVTKLNQIFAIVAGAVAVLRTYWAKEAPPPILIGRWKNQKVIKVN
jgi:hypothetical protein